jgi:hypothetical protein
LHRSAKEPETSVAAVAAKTNWKNHLESLSAEKEKIKVKLTGAGNFCQVQPMCP